MGCWVGLDVVDERENLLAYREPNPDSSVIQQIVKEFKVKIGKLL
jgi:hypothetical protein